METRYPYEGEGELADAIRLIQRQLATSDSTMQSACFTNSDRDRYKEALSRALELLIPEYDFRERKLRAHRAKKDLMLSQLMDEGKTRQEALDILFEHM